MRMLLKVQMDVEAGNRAIKDGTLSATLERALGEVRPEASYFIAEDGLRTALIFFNLERESQIPVVAEPFFMNLGARVTLVPAMNSDDVRAGLEEASKAF